MVVQHLPGPHRVSIARDTGAETALGSTKKRRLPCSSCLLARAAQRNIYEIAGTGTNSFSYIRTDTEVCIILHPNRKYPTTAFVSVCIGDMVRYGNAKHHAGTRGICAMRSAGFQRHVVTDQLEAQPPRLNGKEPCVGWCIQVPTASAGPLAETFEVSKFRLNVSGMWLPRCR